MEISLMVGTAIFFLTGARSLKSQEALADKAVRLTSIIPSYPKKEGEEDSRPFSYTDLQKIAPLDMLRHTFTNRFGGDLPEELEKMFNDVMREVSL